MGGEAGRRLVGCVLSLRGNVCWPAGAGERQLPRRCGSDILADAPFFFSGGAARAQVAGAARKDSVEGISGIGESGSLWIKDGGPYSHFTHSLHSFPLYYLSLGLPGRAG
jgi:hypothetical protein